MNLSVYFTAVHIRSFKFTFDFGLFFVYGLNPIPHDLININILSCILIDKKVIELIDIFAVLLTEREIAKQTQFRCLQRRVGGWLEADRLAKEMEIGDGSGSGSNHLSQFQ